MAHGVQVWTADGRWHWRACHMGQEATGVEDWSLDARLRGLEWVNHKISPTPSVEEMTKRLDEMRREFF